ncbi:MAG: hypothetical protein LIO79_06480 [Rikenellaceae bacterium]|nr:hypothetical protein [Rikenellaceae bacterium]
MLPENLNKELIDSMKAKLPGGTNLANLLMDILYIGKEAVYRRLRGEVPFTLSESVIISRKLGISLDQLIGKSFNGNALFALNIINHADPLDSYYSRMCEWSDTLYAMIRDDYSELDTSSNLLPNFFPMKYPVITRFLLFRWMYQQNLINCIDKDCFDKLTIPDKLADKQEELSVNVQKITKTCFIWDKMIISDFINNVKYFAGINLFSDGNISDIKFNLMYLLDDMEEIAARGSYNNGNQVDVYLSNINFETTYSYFRSQSVEMGSMRVFGVNTVTTQDAETCAYVRNWINSLKKFSTLISQSGEMQRIQFFKSQREIVMDL